GIGVFAMRSQPMLTTADVSLRASVVEGNENVGVLAACAAATVDSTVVRDNEALAADLGGGIIAGQCADQLPSSLTLTGSIVERNTELGVLAIGAGAIIDTT